MSWYTSGKLWSFVGGVAAAGVASFVSKQPKTREIAVATVAQGMRLQQACADGIQSIKEDAEDLAAEARETAKAQAAEADRRAQIEARVREQVEAEFAAEDAKAAKAASASASKTTKATALKPPARRTRKAAK